MALLPSGEVRCYPVVMLKSEVRARIDRWIAEDPDPTTQDELRRLLAAPDPSSADLADRFAGDLTFGTAGLRGIIGAGPNRMNRAVVARATWALARELMSSVPQAAARGVVIAGDARRMSREFVSAAATVAAGAGVRVHLFRAPVATPIVGFAVKRLRAAAGIVITASHNPSDYNGYKVYWENGAQIVPPIDVRIAAFIERAPPACTLLPDPVVPPALLGAVVDVPADIEADYLRALQSLAVHPRSGRRAFPIAYTPLHGVGNVPLRAALSAAGFSEVTSVVEQENPDGAFPTVAFPNPEEPGAMDLALSLGRRIGAELVMANDPDVDRLAVAIRDPAKPTRDSGYVQLTGNEVGVLLGHYLLTERPAATRPRAVLASIVSSPLLGKIAASLGVHYEETLTGFKWIANRAIELDRSGYEFVFGFEEALGYSIGDLVHDKDGISAALLFAELTAVVLERGRTVRDELDAIARRWGAHVSAQHNIVRPGSAGVSAILEMMDGLRAAPPRSIGDDEVVAVADYQTAIRIDLRSGARTPIALPRSNVLAFELRSEPSESAPGARIVARPSGTEPKAKFYFDVWKDVRGGEPVQTASDRALRALHRLEQAFLACLPGNPGNPASAAALER